MMSERFIKYLFSHFSKLFIYKIFLNNKTMQQVHEQKLLRNITICTQLDAFRKYFTKLLKEQNVRSVLLPTIRKKPSVWNKSLAVRMKIIKYIYVISEFVPTYSYLIGLLVLLKAPKTLCLKKASI